MSDESTTSIKSELITDRVKSYEDACKIKGINPDDLPELSKIPKEFHKTIISGYKLMIIHAVLNEGEVMDPSNHDKWRYSTWGVIVKDKSKPSGFAFSGAGCNDWGANASVAARLLLRNSELAEYSIKQFEELHIDYFIG